MGGTDAARGKGISPTVAEGAPVRRQGAHKPGSSKGNGQQKREGLTVAQENRRVGMTEETGRDGEGMRWVLILRERRATTTTEEGKRERRKAHPRQKKRKGRPHSLERRKTPLHDVGLHLVVLLDAFSKASRGHEGAS